MFTGLAIFHFGKTDHLAAPDATAMKLHISGNCYRDDLVYFNLISWSKFFALVVAHACWWLTFCESSCSFSASFNADF